jgi:Hypervirulence associated proteins TUDOR domain
MSELSVGDRVSWNTSQGRTRGKIVERHERDFTFDGQHFRASDREPAFVVESEKTGARAAHKPGALRRLAD